MSRTIKNWIELLPLWLALNAVLLALDPDSVLARRVLTYDSVAARGSRVQLLNREHRDSPLRRHGLSLTERYAESAKRSRSRAASLRNRVSRREILNLGRAQLNESITSPVSPHDNEYVMTITLGSPSRTFTAVADTGSDLVWVQCTPCPNCTNQPDPLFDPRKSSTYETLGCSNSYCQYLTSYGNGVTDCVNSTGICNYHYGYGGGEQTSGVLASETFTLSTTDGEVMPVANFTFGCGKNDIGDFFGTDGLVGLGRGPLSLPSQLTNITGASFSYCLVTFSDATTKASPLILGDAARPSNRSTMQYTPFVNTSISSLLYSSFYYVRMEAISVDGEKLDIPPSVFELNQDGSGGTFFDSGTTLTFLINEAYEPLREAVAALIKYPTTNGSDSGFDLCYDVTNVLAPVFPTITYHFTGADMVLPQQNSFVLVDSNGTTCFTSIPAHVGIIGNLQQQNFLLLFDQENAVLGLKSHQCDSS